MLQPVSTLDLSKETISELYENGFLYVEDVTSTSETFDKNTDKIREVQNSWNIPATVSALDIWQEESRIESISSFSETLNNILDGGFQCGTITELCGAQGSAKTQICLQSCVTVQLSKRYGGLQGRAVYIDARNGISAKRLEDLVKGCQNYHKDLYLDVNKILEGITVVSPKTSADLMTVVCGLKKYLAENAQVRVVIIDSLSFLVQCCIEDPWQRTQFYFRILDELQDLLMTKNVAVIVVNELITQTDNNGEVCFSSAGGQLVAHRMHKRLMLVRLTDIKFAVHTLKTPLMPQITVLFQITRDGVRDINENNI